MAPVDATSQNDEAANERQPLLGNGAIEGQNGHTEANETGDSTPLSKTPSTGRIFLILGSIWLGVFFAAL